MAQEEKKDGKQVVLPYDEYQEMSRKIADNLLEMTVHLKLDNGYPIVDLKDIGCQGKDDGELKKTIRRLFHSILQEQNEWVHEAQNRFYRMENELSDLRNKKKDEARLSQKISDLEAKNKHLIENITGLKHITTKWEIIAKSISGISVIIIILLLIFK